MKQLLSLGLVFSLIGCVGPTLTTARAPAQQQSVSVQDLMKPQVPQSMTISFPNNPNAELGKSEICVTCAGAKACLGTKHRPVQDRPFEFSGKYQAVRASSSGNIENLELRHARNKVFYRRKGITDAQIPGAYSGLFENECPQAFSRSIVTKEDVRALADLAGKGKAPACVYRALGIKAQSFTTVIELENFNGAGKYITYKADRAYEPDWADLQLCFGSQDNMHMNVEGTPEVRPIPASAPANETPAIREQQI